MSITIVLIVITVVVSFLAFNNNNIKDQLIFSPYVYTKDKNWWLVFSHGFIHADYLHLFFNMYVLYVFGLNVEYSFYELNTLGNLYFFLLYIGGMVFATLPSIIKHRNNSSYRSLGASGAVSAVVFSFIILDPTAGMGIIFLPGLSIPAFVFGILYLLAENYMSKKGNTNIAHEAHIAGAIFGLIFLGFFDYKVYTNFFESITIYLGIS